MELKHTMGDNPWCNAGDFNAKLTMDDRKGGATLGTLPCPRFRKWLMSSEMLDIGFQRPSFTWSKGSLLERIDRAFFNQKWLECFSSSSMLYLPQGYSDHRLLLIKSHNQVKDGKIKPFHFVMTWVTHNGFPEMVRNSWDQGTNITDSISRFQEAATMWNKKEFGHIDKKKRILKARIKGVQLALEHRYSMSLSIIEADMLKKYKEVLTQEELLWFQKSRSNWI